MDNHGDEGIEIIEKIEVEDEAEIHTIME